MNSDSVAGKIAVVTGATKGIGRAIAKSLVSAGAKVVITARDERQIASTISELNRIGPGTATGYVCDVRNYDQVKSFFAEIGEVEQRNQQHGLAQAHGRFLA